MITRDRAKRIAAEIAVNELQGCIDLGHVNECAETAELDPAERALVIAEVQALITIFEGFLATSRGK